MDDDKYRGTVRTQRSLSPDVDLNEMRIQVSKELAILLDGIDVEEKTKKQFKPLLCSILMERREYASKYRLLLQDKRALQIQVNIEREKFVKAYGLLSLRLYLEQLEREFREGSRAPEKDQMVKDLKSKGEKIAFTEVSVQYIEWVWFLRCSSYGPAKGLYRLVRKSFNNLEDFVELLSRVWSEASDKIYYPLDPLTCEEVKLGLKFHGLWSKGMDIAVDILFKLKEWSPRRKRRHLRPSVSSENESKKKKVTLDHTRIVSTSDTSTSSVE